MNAIATIHKSIFAMNKFKSKAGLSTLDLENASRLSTTIEPSNYTLCIKPNFSTFGFEGCVAIKLLIKKESKTMILNAADLNISKIMWEEDVTENRQEPIEYSQDNEKQQLKIMFEPALLPSSGLLRINFNGDMKEKPVGIYRSKYIGLDGEEKFNIATRFEPANARTCFPCWDEPALKATFDISFIVPRSMTAISNMPLKVTYPHRTRADLHVVEFDTTPLSSTYSIGFAIGSFDFLESIAPNGTKCRIYTTPEMSAQGKFALALCSMFLPFYEEYFGLPFPLPKLDIVAVAESSYDSSSSWGLITFKESGLLVENVESMTIPFRTALCLGVSHVLCLQWLGNLVSPEWWTNFWLDEAFATFASFLTVDQLTTEYDLWNDFANDLFLETLILDAFKSNHPIEVSIGQPADLKESMDKTCRTKAAVVIRMLQKYLGEETFKKGVKSFMASKKYKGAKTDELWYALETVSDKPIYSIMNSWTRQSGFPLVRVTTSRYEMNQRTVVLTQEKFWADPLGRDNKQLNKDHMWYIPIAVSVATQAGKIVKEFVMDKKSYHLSIPNISRTQLFKLNPGTIGFFRVKYPPEMLGQFLQAIRTKSIPPMDRLGVVSDLYAMCMAGLNSAVELFSLLEAFSDEDNYLVWRRLDYIFGCLETLLQSTESYEKLKYFGCSIFANTYDRLGWNIDPSEKYEQSKLRIMVVNRMFMFNHDRCKGEAFLLYEKMAEEPPPPELRSVVYKAGMDGGNSETYRAILRLYRESEDDDEPERLLSSLGFNQDDEILHDALEFATNELRHQETIIVFKSICSSAKGKLVAWDFFKEHWTLFRSRYAAGSELIELVETITFGFTTEDKSTEIFEFFRDHSFPGIEKTVQQALEKIHIAVSFLKHEGALIYDYLVNYE